MSLIASMGEAFGYPIATAALTSLDHSITISIKGEGYRLCKKLKSGQSAPK